MNTCPQSARILDDFDSTPDLERDLRAHAATCEACADALVQRHRMRRLLYHASRVELSPELLAQLHETVAARFEPPALRTLRMLTAVAAVLLVGCLLRLWQAPHTPPESPEVSPVSGSVELEPWELVAANPFAEGRLSLSDHVLGEPEEGL